MKIPSKSILSPGRTGYTRDPPPISLQTSLSRRLSHSRSIKGAASPAMFPIAGKKRGSGFENPEPSSPKVTCIGQVRVKTKKKHPKPVRSLSKVRKLEHSTSQNQRVKCSQGQQNNSNSNTWVHIPLTICEALRALGSEVSCLFPCRSSCTSTSSMKNDEMNSFGSRWMVEGNVNVSYNNGDDDENVVNLRKHVFDDLEIVDDVIIGSRVSVCVPPKNALLLMRCRSDPAKMEALTSRFWEPDMNIDEDGFVDYESMVEEEKISQEGLQLKDEKYEISGEFNDEDCVGIDSELEMKWRVQEDQSLETNEDEESFFLGSLFEENVAKDEEFEELEADIDMVDALEQLFEDEDKDEDVEEQVKKFAQEIEEILTKFADKSSVPEETNVENKETDIENGKVEVNNGEIDDRKKTNEALPQCLLLMMYEPKLSMEVSKETWVSRSDFIHGQKPPPRVEPMDGQDGSMMAGSVKEHANQYQSVAQQPARSSCSMLDENLGFEPFGLTRCKSEPIRTATPKLAPENCYWTPRRASFDVGMAGIGIGLGFCRFGS